MNAPVSITPPYRHSPLFPLGHDTTPYRKLSSDGVRVEKVMGEDVVVISRPITFSTRTPPAPSLR